MKKFYFLGALAMLLCSCSNSGGGAIFSVNPVVLNFPQTGGAKTFTVTYTQENGSWTVTTSEDWITLYGASGTTSGVVTIELGENSNEESLNAVLQVTGDGFSPLFVTITQEGAEPTPNINESSSLSRMNIKGDVSELSHYVDYTQGIVILENLKFNTNGMLTYFETVTAFDFRDEFTITYDSTEPTRVVNIKGTRNLEPFELALEYGTHGKYIPVRDPFFMVDNQGCQTYWQFWMPRLIKNLAGIEFITHPNPEVYSVELSYKITGNDGELWIVGEDVATSYNEAFQWTTFEGEYPESAYYIYSFYGMPMIWWSIYDINTVNGGFNKYTQDMEDMYFGGRDTYREMTYNDDSYNSYATIFDMDVFGSDTQTVTYNSNGNMTAIGDLVSFSGYVYDSENNWTSVAITANGGTENYSRTITYR